MVFSSNAPILFMLAGCVILFVCLQCIHSLKRALAQAKVLGLDMGKIKECIISSAVFSIVPAIAVLIGVIAMAGKFGIVLPWLRLSVIGALHYETVAAGNCLEGFVATGAIPSEEAVTATTITPQILASCLIVAAIPMMTGSILSIAGVVKTYQTGMGKISRSDPVWMKILMSALFLGCIGTFMGKQFAGVPKGGKGWTPVFVMLVSVFVMLFFMWLMKKTKSDKLKEFALPVSMIVGMAMAIPINALLGG